MDRSGSSFFISGSWVLRSIIMHEDTPEPRCRCRLQTSSHTPANTWDFHAANMYRDVPACLPTLHGYLPTLPYLYLQAYLLTYPYHSYQQFYISITNYLYTRNKPTKHNQHHLLQAHHYFHKNQHDHHYHHHQQLDQDQHNH